MSNRVGRKFADDYADVFHQMLQAVRNQVEAYELASPPGAHRLWGKDDLV